VISVAFGIALIGVENKQSLLDILAATSKTLSRIAMMVVKVTPIGVFAIAVNASGRTDFTGFKLEFEDPYIWRRDRTKMLKIHADPREGLPSELLGRINPLY